MNEEELLQLKGEKKIPFPTMVKRILSYGKGTYGLLVLAFLFLLLNLAITLFLPYMMGYFIDLYELPLGGPDAEFFNKLLYSIIFFSVGYALLSILANVFRLVEGLILQNIGQKIVYNLRVDIFSHIENLSQNQLLQMPVGALVTRVANYTSHVSHLFSDVLINVLSNALTIVGVFAIMVFQNWVLSLIMLGFALVIGIISLVFGRLVHKRWKAQRGKQSDLNAFLSENLSGMPLTELFNQQDKKIAQFEKKNEDLKNAAYSVNITFAMYRPLLSFLYFCAIAVTFGFGVTIFSAGQIVSFYLYLSRFFNPIENLADQFNQISNATSSMERILNLLDVEPEVTNCGNPLTIEHFQGKIEFRHVWFAYEKENWVLKDVSFVVNPKESLALVGATGSGKTTILSLIVRNYKPQKGEIFIDDINIDEIDISCLRKLIGQMMQEVYLFSGTIRDNITIHDERFTDEDVHYASEFVGSDEFISRLPNGYNEELAEGGLNLSQGQRQLLSFARTIIHKPEILLLDEATANIDAETEITIQHSLEKMKTLGTMVVVAHRLSTIQHSTNILVLKNGEIVEHGNHQALLKNRGLYYQLYRLQMMGKAK